MTPVDVLPTEAQWGRLTRVAPKRRAYEEDLYFREAWADWQEACGDPCLPALESAALLCAKPDAVVGRRLGAMLDYVVDHGFAPTGAFEFRLDRHSMREIWRHDWHVYPADRLVYCTQWYTGADVAMFVLRDERPLARVPGSVRLAQLKGNAIAAKRRPGELRTQLRPPNSVLNFVHVPDEPADILREIGIVFDRPRRLELLGALAGRGPREGAAVAGRVIAALEKRFPAHDLDFAASLARMRERGALSESESRQLARSAESGEKLSWARLCGYMGSESSLAERWDFISVASHLIPLEREGTAGLLPGVSARAWAEGSDGPLGSQ